MHTGYLNLKPGYFRSENSPLLDSGGVGASVPWDPRAGKPCGLRVSLGRRPFYRHTAHALVLALAAVLSPTKAQAAWLGHTRIVSASGAPLRIEVPIMGLSDSDAQALRVNLADLSAWQAAGLKPPVPLPALKLTLLPVQSQEGKFKRVVIIESTQAPAELAVDILLDLALPGAQRQVQVSVLATPLAPQQLPLAAGKPARSVSNRAAAGRGTQASVPTTLASRKISVQPGDTLVAIARRYQPASTTRAQMLVALWQINQKAFNQENMNFLRQPVQLTLPTSEAVRAINPEEALRTLEEQTKAFHAYRARLARETQTAHSSVPVTGANAGRVTPPQSLAAASAVTAQDRLRLASSDATGISSTDAKSAPDADSRVASQKAMNEAQTRIAILQKNLADIHQEMAMPDKSATASTPTQAHGGVKNSGPLAETQDVPRSQAPKAASTNTEVDFSSQDETALPESMGNHEMRRILLNGILGGMVILGLLFSIALVLLRRRRATFTNGAEPTPATSKEGPLVAASLLEDDGLISKKE
jgi:FimV-like protein